MTEDKKVNGSIYRRNTLHHNIPKSEKKRQTFVVIDFFLLHLRSLALSFFAIDNYNFVVKRLRTNSQKLQSMENQI